MCPHARAHWCCVANAVQLVLPSSHPSPQPKQQISWFSHFLHSSQRSVVWQIDATWQVQLNMCFFRPIRVHNPNNKSISSVVFAQLMAESLCALQCVPLFPKLALSHGASGLPSYALFLGPMQVHTTKASWSVWLFLHRWPHTVPILYNGTPLFPSKLPLSIGQSGLPSNMWFPGPSESHPKWHLGSAIFAWLTSVTDRPTDRPTNHTAWSVTIYR